MNDMTEQVALPTVAAQPLVHPLDVPAARAAWRRGWLIDVFTNPGVAASLGVAVGLLSGNVLVGVAAAAITVALGRVAARAAWSDAWAHIPRRRQDRARRLPASWRLAASGFLGVALAMAAALTLMRLAQPDVSVGVRAFVLGSGGAAVVLVVLDWLSGAVHRGPAPARRAWTDAPAVGSVVAVALVAPLLIGDGVSSGHGVTALWGVLTMVAAAGIGLLVGRATHR